jgi:hypothetical protein
MEEEDVIAFWVVVLLVVLVLHGANNEIPVVKLKDAEVKCADNGGLYDVEVGFFYDEAMCKNYATFKLPNITQYKAKE